MNDTYVTPPPLEEAFKATGTPTPKKQNKKILLGGLLIVVFFTIIGAVLYSSGIMGTVNNDIRQRAAGTTCGCEGGNYVCHYSWGGSDSWPRDSCKQQSQPTQAPTQPPSSGGTGGSSGGSSGGGCRGASNCTVTCSNGQSFSDACPGNGSFSSCDQWKNEACGSRGGVSGGSSTPTAGAGACTTGNSRCIGKAPGYYNLSQVAGVTDCYQCTNMCALVPAPGKCGGIPAGGGEATGGGSTSGGLKPGYECNPGVGLPYNGDIRCGAAGGCANSTMGQLCGVDGKWASGCVRAHACGYVDSTGECNVNKNCQSLGYGASYTCNITTSKCVDTAHNNRYFIGCSNSNPCLNCYSDGVCVMENSSCSIKPECRGGTTAPTTTVTQTAQATTQPTKQTTQAPTSTVTASPSPTTTVTVTVTVTATATPTPNSCNGTCTGDSNCQSGLVCSGGYCRNSSCTSESSCVCATATATSTPTPYSCNGTCSSDSNCQSGLVCSGGYCRNPSCTSESSCTCPQIAQTTPTATPAPASYTPAPTNLPDAGFNIPTVAAFGGGLLMVILGMLFAL